MTFFFIWRWLLLNKSYSICGRELTQWKSYTSTIHEMSIHSHKSTRIFCTVQTMFSMQLKHINHSKHKPLHSQNMQCPDFILQYEIVPNNYYFHGFQNTLFHQILSEDFVGLLGFQYTKVYSPKGICLTPLLRLLCRFCTIVCLPPCRLGLYPSRFIYWPTYALPRHQGISWS